MCCQWNGIDTVRGDASHTANYLGPPWVTIGTVVSDSVRNSECGWNWRLLPHYKQIHCDSQAMVVVLGGLKLLWIYGHPRYEGHSIIIIIIIIIVTKFSYSKVTLKDVNLLCTAKIINKCEYGEYK